jgi:hypothetical protein
LPVQGESKVPVDVFGSGPRVIDVAARLGDKLTVAVGAEPERLEWAVGTAREARRAAGLDPESIDIGAFVVVGAGTDQRALDELVRGNASISAHFQRDVTSSLSRSDATVVEEVTSRYDNYHHGLEHASQAEVIPDDFLSRFCVIGSPDECTERLCELVGLGLSSEASAVDSRSHCTHAAAEFVRYPQENMSRRRSESEGRGVMMGETQNLSPSRQGAILHPVARLVGRTRGDRSPTVSLNHHLSRNVAGPFSNPKAEVECDRTVHRSRGCRGAGSAGR